MAFTETVLKIRDSITEEQSTELREFLVKAYQQLQADPELMAMGLQRLKEEVTDQGYEWENLMGTMLQLIEPSLTIESAKKLKAAWNDSMASNATIADFTAILNSDFPIINEVFRNLVNEALEEHNDLIGFAGGTHIGQGIATAGSKTGKALASPWNKNSKLNKEPRIMAETAEVGLVGTAAFFGGRAVGTKIYEVGDKKQLWGTINQKIGGSKHFPEYAPTFRQWTSESLVYPLDHPTKPGLPKHLGFSSDNPKGALKELTTARDKLKAAGTLTKDQEETLFDNAYNSLGQRGRQDLRQEIVAALHPDPEIRTCADFLGKLKANFELPDSLEAPLMEVEAAFRDNKIAIDKLDNTKIANIYEKAVRSPTRDLFLNPNDVEVAMEMNNTEKTKAMMSWDPPGGVKEDNENQCFREFMKGINEIDTKLMIYNHAIRNDISFKDAVKFYTSSPNDVYQEPKETDLNQLISSNASKGLDRNGDPLSNSENKLNKASSMISYRPGFSYRPPNFEEQREHTWNDYRGVLKRKEAEITGKLNPEQGPSRNWAEELVEKGEVQGIGEKLGGVNPRRARRVISEDASDFSSGMGHDRGSVSGFANDLAGDNPELSVQEFSGLASESSYREFSGIEDFAEDEVDAAVNEGKDAASNLVEHEVDAAGNLVDNAESDL